MAWVMRDPPSLLACKSSLDHRTFQDRRQIQAGRHGSECATPRTTHATGQERFRDGRVAVADKQRALQRQADVLGDLAGPVLNRVEVRQRGPQRGYVGIQPWI